MEKTAPDYVDTEKAPVKESEAWVYTKDSLDKAKELIAENKKLIEKYVADEKNVNALNGLPG